MAAGSASWASLPCSFPTVRFWKIAEEAFALDARYCKKRELFTDIFIVIKRLIASIRGDGKSYLGETAELSYGETLLKRGTITETDLANAKRNAEEALKNEEMRAELKNRK